MDAGVLEELGLSRNEARVYLALLSLREAKNAAIAMCAGVYRRNSYDALERLIDKGLVVYRVEKKVKYFRCASPENLHALLKEKEKKLAAVLPQLLKAFAAPTLKRDVVILRGAEWMKQVWKEFAASKKRLSMLSFTELKYLEDRAFVAFLHSIAHRLQVKARILVVDNPLVRKHLHVLRRIRRVFEVKFIAGELSSVWFAVADEAAFVCFMGWTSKELMYVRIASKEAADAFEKIFDALWDTAKK